MSVANQILFMLLYVVPVVNVPSDIKTVLFVILIIFAYFIYYVAPPKKINWMMSVVDDKKRGSFTANKEIFSLITGMIFSFLMGALIDMFKERNDMKTAFILSTVTIFVVMVLHTLSMLFTIDKSVDIPVKSNIFDNDIIG